MLHELPLHKLCFFISQSGKHDRVNVEAMNVDNVEDMQLARVSSALRLFIHPFLLLH